MKLKKIFSKNGHLFLVQNQTLQKKVSNDFFKKSIESIMLRIVKCKNHVVSIRIFAKNRRNWTSRNLETFSGSLGTFPRNSERNNILFISKTQCDISSHREIKQI